MQLEAFDEHVARTEEFPDAHCHVIVEKTRELGVHEVYIRTAAARLDLHPAVEQKFRGQFPKKNWIERRRIIAAG